MPDIKEVFQVSNQRYMSRKMEREEAALRQLELHISRSRRMLQDPKALEVQKSVNFHKHVPKAEKKAQEEVPKSGQLKQATDEMQIRPWRDACENKTGKVRKKGRQVWSGDNTVINISIYERAKNYAYTEHYLTFNHFYGKQVMVLEDIFNDAPTRNRGPVDKEEEEPKRKEQKDRK